MRKDNCKYVCQLREHGQARSYCYVNCDCHCFPSLSVIQLINGSFIPMSDLQIGDQVQTSMYKHFIILTHVYITKIDMCLF